jgi:CRP/FNR family transcriptional regulator, cyclic AMP receptor protein
MKQGKKEHPFNPNAFLSTEADGRTVANYARGRVIYRQGDAASAAYYIQSGTAKLTVTSETGKEAVVAVLGPDDFFGEGCANGESVRLSTAVALSECTIMRITRTEIGRVIHTEPAFAEFFISHLLNRYSHVQADLVDQLFNSSEKRLARALLILANFGTESDPEPVLAKISQETLAEMVGTTRARVNYFMNKFRRLGLIDYNGRIVVRPSLLGLVLHERPQIKT